MDQNNVTPNSGQGTPVNERDSSFGNNVRGFNKPGGNTKGYQESSAFSKDKSFGPQAQSGDDEGMTHADNFDGHHIKVGTPENNHQGLQPSSEFSFDKSHGGTQPTGNTPTGELSADKDAPTV